MDGSEAPTPQTAAARDPAGGGSGEKCKSLRAEHSNDGGRDLSGWKLIVGTEVSGSSEQSARLGVNVGQ